MYKVFAVLFSAAALIYAQGTTALLSGTVQDPTGAAVPGASITVTNTETNQIVRTETNEKGEYALPSMPPGTYHVGIVKPGFKAELKQGVVIESGVPATVNVKLEVGQAAETVVVQGEIGRAHV